MNAAKPLWSIQLDVNLTAFRRWLASRNLHDPDHGLHCLLAETYGVSALRPFRLIPESQKFRNFAENHKGKIIAYSTHTPDELKATAHLFAEPLPAEVADPQRLSGRQLPPMRDLPTGKLLGFDLRCHPMRRFHPNPNINRRGPYVDVYDVAMRTENPRHRPTTQRAELARRKEIYTAWLDQLLQDQGAGYLARDSVDMRRYRRIATVHQQGQAPARGPEVILRGNMTLNDGDALEQILRTGVGRRRAYGFGMFILRQPQSA